MLQSQLSPSENAHGETARDLATQVLTFASTNHWFVCYVLTRYGVKLEKASGGLKQLAMSNAGSPAGPIRKIAAALKIHFMPASVSRPDPLISPPAADRAVRP